MYLKISTGNKFQFLYLHLFYIATSIENDWIQEN